MGRNLVIIEVDPSIREAVEASEGDCPCAIERNADTKCMCKAFREQDHSGECHCGRFAKVNKGGGENGRN